MGHTKIVGDAVDLEGSLESYCVALAKCATKNALDAMRDDDDASEHLSLAVAAWSVVVGDASADVRADMADYRLAGAGVYEPLCICPPDLLARGGFRGSCPVHGTHIIEEN
jgi:hypothetical protein